MDKINFDKVVDFYNNSTLDERVVLLSLMAKSIMIPTPSGVGSNNIRCVELSDEKPAVPNGVMIQLNTKDFEDYDDD